MKTVVLTPDGRVALVDRPAPGPAPERVLVRTRWSLISAGTEMDGIRRRAENPDPIGSPTNIGYSACGIVEQSDLPEYVPGQAVAVYGAPYVHHGELLSVPRNLVRPVPDGVSLQAAACVGLGAVAVHAVRRAELSFGELAVVPGLGVLGNLVAQICRAAAYPTLGTDMVPERLAFAEKVGLRVLHAGDHAALKAEVMAATEGRGADGVLICAGGGGDTFIDQAIDLIRFRGRVVVVGNIRPSFDRSPWFAKEADVVIARAAGPGRYDPLYERDGIDYPPGYARWTEGRNMGEYLRLLSTGAVQAEPLITHRVPASDAPAAYDYLAKGPAAAMGVLIDWS